MKDKLVIKGTQATLPECDEEVIEMEPYKKNNEWIRTSESEQRQLDKDIWCCLPGKGSVGDIDEDEEPGKKISIQN